MKKLERLTLKDLGESTFVLNPSQAARFIGGSGDGTYSNPYMLPEVVVTAHAPINSACSNEHGVVVAGFVLEGPDGAGGLLGAGQNGGYLTKEQEQALLNIITSLSAFALHITEPILIVGDDFWRNYINGSY